MNKLNLSKFWRSHPNRDLVSYITFYNRVKKGMTLEEAMSPYRAPNWDKNADKNVENESKSLLKFYKEHPNPDNITYESSIGHVKVGNQGLELF